VKIKTGWLERVNPNWKIVPGHALFSERKTKSKDSDTHLTPSQIYGVLPQSEYLEKTGSGVVLNLVGSDAMKHVEPNDFIIHLRSFQGGIEHSRYSGKVSNAYCVLIPSSHIEPRFYRWVLKSTGFIQELRSTTDQLRDGQSIKFEQFRTVGLPLPSLEEQREIADYLDGQIAALESVINLKQQEQKLLASAAQAEFTKVFGHPYFSAENTSITRRLGPCLRGNDGGVWGDEPTGIDDFIVLRSTEISQRGYWRNLESAAFRKLDSREAGKSILHLNDVLVTKASGSADHIGKAAIVTAEVAALKACFGNFMQRIRVNPSVYLPEYLHYFLKSLNARSQLNFLGTTSTGLLNVSAEVLNNLRLPVLSLHDQQEAISILREVERTLDARMNLLENSISTCNDLRTSLLTAVVTGTYDIGTRMEIA
jgi:type I restriction enzyme, S subunit